MYKKIEEFEKKYLKKEIPNFNVGDTITVFVKIVEEGKARTQAFEGTVIRKRGRGTKASFTVRRISYGEGVERTFLLHSPFIEKIEVKKRGVVRKSKLYYLRGKVGKKTRIEERIEKEETAPNSETREKS